MKYLFTSERLLYREFQIEDAEFLFRLNNDPDVIKYTGNLPFKTIQEAENFVKDYDHYKKYGYGRWTVVKKSNLKAIGWCGLKYLASEDQIDLGYRFLQSEWNNGYATESGIASLNYAREQLKINRVVGRAIKENIASVKVLENIGMKYAADIDFDGAAGVLYDILLNNY